MKKIKLVCFDIGGTLVYHKHKWRYQEGYHGKEYGIDKGLNIRKARAEFFDAEVHQNINKAVRTFMQIIGVKRNKEKFFDMFKKGMRSDHQHLRYYKDAKHTLKALREKGYKIAFITNWHQYARDHFECIGLSKYADHLLVSAEHGKRKPHPSLFKTVLKIFRLKPSEALMIGDHPRKDYLAAKKIGMHSLLLERGRKRRDHSIKTLNQVFAYLKKANGRRDTFK